MIVYINNGEEVPKSLTNVIGRYFASKSEWKKLLPQEKHFEMMKIIFKRRKEIQFTGISALYLYGIPHNEIYDLRPCCRKKICAGKKDEAVNWIYSGRCSNFQTINGLRVVPPLEVIYDFAKTCSLVSLFIAVNYCLSKKMFSLSALQNRFAIEKNSRGKRKVQALMSFFNPKLESWLESIAWIKIYNSGLKLPELQYEVKNKSGLIGRVDMMWIVRGKTLLVEFDGRIKYTEFADSNTLYNEKLRQEKIESLGQNKVIRFVFDDVKNNSFIKKLISEGVTKRQYSKKKFPQ